MKNVVRQMTLAYSTLVVCAGATAYVLSGVFPGGFPIPGIAKLVISSLVAGAGILILEQVREADEQSFRLGLGIAGVLAGTLVAL